MTIFTNDANAYATFELLGSMHQDTLGVGLNPYVATVAANGSGTIEQPLPRSAATRQGSKWKITVKSGRGQTIFVEDNYTVPSAVRDTVLIDASGN